MVAGVVLSALIVGFVLDRVCHRYAKRFQDSWRGTYFSLLESLPVPLLLLVALYNTLQVFPLPDPWDHVGSKLLLIVVIVVAFYFPAKMSIVFMRRLSLREPGLERVAQPAIFLIRVLAALVAVIVVLENLGVHLTAVWTTLGVGSVAVALALQETLSNFFAGLYLLADRPINPNDYVRLDSGQEGYVVRIGWRSTLIRTLPNNLVVVPNSTLAKAIITNYSLPEPRTAASVQVSVSYGSDPNRVETILAEIARDAAREGLEGLLSTPEPAARLIPGFGASTLDFSLGFHVRQFTDQYFVQSELRKRILERFRREGIHIPFPSHSILIEKVASAAEGNGNPKL